MTKQIVNEVFTPGSVVYLLSGGPAMTVVGITDPAFHGTAVVYDVELYVPVMMAPQLGFRPVTRHLKSIRSP